MEVKLSFYSSSLLFSPLPTSFPSAPKFMTIFFRPQRAMALPSFRPPPHTFPSSYLICVPYTHSNRVATMCTKKARKSERQKSSPERPATTTYTSQSVRRFPLGRRSRPTHNSSFMSLPPPRPSCRTRPTPTPASSPPSPANSLRGILRSGEGKRSAFERGYGGRGRVPCPRPRPANKGEWHGGGKRAGKKPFSL